MYNTHKNLAEIILKSKYPGIHRNYAGWLYLRKNYSQGDLDIAEAVLIFSQKFKVSKSRAYGMINVGQGIFWNLNKGRLSIIGKLKVLKYFELDLPGKVCLVPEELLFSSLQKWKACLYEITVQGKMIARSTMSKLYALCPQTFINYQGIAEKRPVFNYTDQTWINPLTGEVQRKQLSNYYQEPFYTKTPSHKKKHDWVEVIGNTPGTFVTSHLRLFFNSVEHVKDYYRDGKIDKGALVYVYNKKRWNFHEWFSYVV